MRIQDYGKDFISGIDYQTLNSQNLYCQNVKKKPRFGETCIFVSSFDYFSFSSGLVSGLSAFTSSGVGKSVTGAVLISLSSF